jgi:hypothetical protein
MLSSSFSAITHFHFPFRQIHKQLNEDDSLVCCCNEHRVSVLTVGKADEEREDETTIFLSSSSVTCFLEKRGKKLVFFY